jgi:polar amino acid transport system permease protein
MSLTSDPSIDKATGPRPGAPADGHGTLTVVPLSHPWRRVAVAVTAVVLAQFLHGPVTDPGWERDVFTEFFTAATVLKGVRVTLQLTFYGTVLGFAAGIVLAFMRLSAGPFLSAVAHAYSWAFRSIRSSSSHAEGATR